MHQDPPRDGGLLDQRNQSKPPATARAASPPRTPGAIRPARHTGWLTTQGGAGRPTNGTRVSDTVFEISNAGLEAADQDEQRATYTRVTVILASGTQAWVHVDARARPGFSSGHA